MSWLKGFFDTESPYSAGDSSPALAAELIEAEAMASEIGDYLLGDRLFRQIVVETPLGTRRPKMTLGSLWERILHLQAATDLGPMDQERLSVVENAWKSANGIYPDRFKRKLRRELDSYLKNWRYYLDQRAQNPDRWDADYPAELRNRQRVGLVVSLLGSDAPHGLMDDLESLERDYGVDTSDERISNGI